MLFNAFDIRISGNRGTIVFIFVFRIFLPQFFFSSSEN